MEANKKQRGDKGIDGWGRLPIRKGQFVDMVSQVKGGARGRAMFKHSTERDSRRAPTWGYSPASMSE